MMTTNNVGQAQRQQPGDDDDDEKHCLSKRRNGMVETDRLL